MTAPTSRTLPVLDPWVICGIIFATPKLLVVVLLLAWMWWDVYGDHL